MGGRLDATNVLNPVVTVITDISLDHTEILGPTLSDITREKAGIIKPDVPTVIGLLPPEARRVVERICRQHGAPLMTLKKKNFKAGPSGLSLDFLSHDLRLSNVVPSLKGRHQLRNAALVLRTAETIHQRGIALPVRAIRAGIENTNWPGRFQIIRKDHALPTVVLDVCHNPGGAEAFADTFRRVFPGKRARVLLGVVKRKAHQEMVDHLAGIASGFWLVPLATGRSVNTRELEAAINWGDLPVRRFAGLDRAYANLLKETDSDDIIAVVGSHYLVGEYLSKYGRA